MNDPKYENQIERTKGRRWKPGESSNPSGRPKARTLSQAYKRRLEEINPNDPQGRTNAECVAEAIIKMALKGNVPACIELADRVEGKVRQAITDIDDEFADKSIEELEERHNGDGGILFATDDGATPWHTEFGKPEKLLWFLDQMLFAEHELSSKDSKTLVLVWLLQQFVPELRRTRLFLCFLGPQGSCKTSAERFIGRLLVGPRFDVTGIRRDKEDSFVAAVTNRVVLGLDNADSRIPWLPDALATYATGQRYRLRGLFSTNEEVAYSPRAILLISSRDPRFNRADVVERLLPLHCERPALYRPEDQIFGELESNRGAIMRALLTQLDDIGDALPTAPPLSPAFRMADFASFGERIFRARGTSGFLALLAKLEKVQAQFASEADGLVEVLRLLLEQESIKDISFR